MRISWSGVGIRVVAAGVGLVLATALFSGADTFLTVVQIFWTPEPKPVFVLPPEQAHKAPSDDLAPTRVPAPDSAAVPH